MPRKISTTVGRNPNTGEKTPEKMLEVGRATFVKITISETNG